MSALYRGLIYSLLMKTHAYVYTYTGCLYNFLIVVNFQSGKFFFNTNTSKFLILGYIK